jgi:hypothetical protein
VARRGRVKLYVGITDPDWHRFLAARPDLDEVNFWLDGGLLWVPDRVLDAAAALLGGLGRR